LVGVEVKHALNKVTVVGIRADITLWCIFSFCMVWAQ